MMISPLINVEQLLDMQAKSNLVILDASIAFQIPGQQPAILNRQIPHARRFDYEHTFCDNTSSLPHMMPSEADFNHHARAIGLNSDSIIVVYDNAGVYASPRAWYMLKTMGHQSVFVLDGGLPAWVEANQPTTDIMPYQGPQGDFSGTLNTTSFIDAQTVLEFSRQDSANIIDARSLVRFHAEVAEPREGLRAGHIPNSVCLPFSVLLDKGYLRAPEALRQCFATLMIDTDKPLVFSCGSGVTACILLLAAQLIGFRDVMVYDGSWSEWGARHDLPIEV